MASLQKTRERIKVVNNIKIITNAVQLVAASKIKQAQKTIENFNKYYNLFSNIFNDLMNDIEKKDIESLWKDNKNPNTLYIIITSDLGLSGSYNSNIFRLADENIKVDDKMYIFGKKGIMRWNTEKYRSMIIGKAFNLGDKIDYKEANKVANTAIEMFKNKKIGAIKIIYTEYINSLTYIENIKQILPFEIKEKQNTKNQMSLVEFEPNPFQILLTSIPMYLGCEIQRCLNISKLSEISSRRFTMENATKNADELANNLKLQYNRERQTKITQEITEIISGSE
ncbi:ATP synthase F1 subunit gamma [Mycoplasma phocimorsus]|uniref:ATP synthase gamma chain n=1 Tax=Mycoplasma phocimorsus TaxID=3045839 RepID=A0AAJ1PTE7_9MOLU|nr:ATP synthase F1 subunit gamma [Mycoplasma phocimorsus]MDJ1645516.1 ATP synthase F1 subunit gamma [Mycoplasma phocimorsus]MDJ1646210.1 ATP synthase F1 subunit gamma [Mycoplasma phocimorsus]MDJ1646808.1 ATP synthase F1 subunit gamma [Mycoplasma phocimorsus]MDJ1647782.1 ATP synthase F1 subunit gamma [Mycoplasma phocimorsus]MDJ1648196.1 ATP synthase F1 subunit gamma [Mycoplasma phocimorsus]